MSICILGSSGMLGSMLEFYCSENDIVHQSITRKDFDVLSDPINKLFTIIRSDTRAIVNCIGAIPQRGYDNEKYFILNERFPISLADKCQELLIPLIHISTNCVFSGSKPSYKEEDIPDAEDIYGKTKYRGEPNNATVIRCSIIGFERTSSFGLLEWFYKNTQPCVYGYIDSYWNGLTTYQLSKIIISHINTNNTPYEIFHYRASNTLSKFDILNYIRNKYKPDIEITPKEAGCKFYTLDSGKTSACPSIQEQIDELFLLRERFYKNHIL